MTQKHRLGWKSNVSDMKIQSIDPVLLRLAAKPVFDFYKELPAKLEVFRTKPTALECHLNDARAPVKWLKNGVPLDVCVDVRLFR